MAAPAPVAAAPPAPPAAAAARPAGEAGAAADPAAAVAAATGMVPHHVPAAAMPGYSPQNASLYVGDLNPDVGESLLYSLFNSIGPVSSIRVPRDTMTRRSLGYAYVNFHNPQDAERALDTLNYQVIKGRPCRIMWSQRDPYLRKSGKGNIFVKNLAPSVDNKSLYDTFSLFGDILSCKVATNPDGTSKGYGYVHYTEEESAKRAIEKVNGMLIADREVFVGEFKRRNERGNGKDWTNCYVKNIPLSWDEDKLKEVFGAHGEIQSLVIMKDAESKSKGFGFVNFTSNEEASAAVDALNDLIVEGEADGEEKADAAKPESEGTAAAAAAGEGDKAKEGEAAAAPAESEADKAKAGEADKSAKEGEAATSATEGGEGKEEAAAAPAEPAVRRLYVSRAQKKGERMKELRSAYESKRAERMTKFQGVNLYIKNLDDTVDDARLRKEFSRFGTITSARVMTDRAGVSKGFGFVCLSSPEEATKAVNDMNGQMINGKPVYVAMAQRKEVRRAQMEAQAQYTRPMGVGGRGMPMQQGYAMGPMMGGMPAGYYQGGMPQGYGAGGYGAGPAGFGMMGGPGPAGRAGGGGRGGRGPGGDRRGMRGGHAGGGGAGHRGGPGGAPMGYPGAAGRGMPGGGYPGGMPAGAGFAGMPGPAGAPMHAGGAPVAPAAAAPAPLPPTAPLTAEALASASPEEQTNMIGERLFPLVAARRRDLAGKITGMLLEMDKSELLNLLESPASLDDKVNEALQVLRAHGTEA